MAKEILLYGSINEYSANEFVTKLESCKDEDVSVRLNTDGGGPADMYCMAAKYSEHKKGKIIKVDGKAYSSGLFLICLTDDVECLDISQFWLHRAAYPSWIEKDPEYMSSAMWDNLDMINGKLRAAFEAKVDMEVYNSLGKPTLDEVFSNESRIDVIISAKEAKKIGLVNKIVQITPKKRIEINALAARVAAQYTSPEAQTPLDLDSKKVNNSIKKYMTAEDLKAENPGLYNQIFAEGVKAGVEQETDRVSACMTFVEIDPVGVKAAIESGKNLTQKQMAEFAMKQTSAATLAKIEGENAPVIATTQIVEKTAKTEKEVAVASADAELNKRLGL